MSDLDRLEQLLREQPRRPPLQRWQPALSGQMDLRIDVRGDWYHEGGLIRRPALVNLFATILRREDDGHYYLVTPQEKWRIEVEDAPLLAVAMEAAGEGAQRQILFSLNTGWHVPLDAAHPLRVISRADGEPRPYLSLEHGLSARLTRALFYELVEQGEWHGDTLGISSAGEWFELGDAGGVAH
jgi:hypothetical protein